MKRIFTRPLRYILCEHYKEQWPWPLTYWTTQWTRHIPYKSNSQNPRASTQKPWYQTHLTLWPINSVSSCRTLQYYQVWRQFGHLFLNYMYLVPALWEAQWMWPFTFWPKNSMTSYNCYAKSTTNQCLVVNTDKNQNWYKKL